MALCCYHIRFTEGGWPASGRRKSVSDWGCRHGRPLRETRYTISLPDSRGWMARLV